MIPPIATPVPHVANAATQDAKLREAAIELEAAFLSEMLKSAGLGNAPKEFDGGAGEDQFASFLRQEQARKMAQAGGIGLAETLFNALKEKSDGQ